MTKEDAIKLANKDYSDRRSKNTLLQSVLEKFRVELQLQENTFRRLLKENTK